MPLWLLLALAGGGFYWWKKRQSSPLPTPQYIANRSAQAFTSDPQKNGLDGATNPFVVLEQGTAVRSTTLPPIRSADNGWEQVQTPQGVKWMDVSDLSPAA